MKRTHGLDEKEMELVKLLMANCQTTGDIQAKLKRLFAGTIEQMLEAEMDEHLGYEKNSVEGNNSGKAVCADLKKIYGAVNLDDAEFAKEEFREKWDKKYPNILKSWDKNLAELTVFFEYPQEIRKIIYTTNAVDGYHRMVRKFTKSKSIFPTDDSIRKVIYMSVTEISKKWTMPVRDWGLAYAQFMIYFEDRFAA